MMINTIDVNQLMLDKQVNNDIHLLSFAYNIIYIVFVFSLYYNGIYFYFFIMRRTLEKCKLHPVSLISNACKYFSVENSVL